MTKTRKKRERIPDKIKQAAISIYLSKETYKKYKDNIDELGLNVVISNWVADELMFFSERLKGGKEVYHYMYT